MLIVAVADDQRKYSFLVKGGEDLRWDQHAQHALRALNQTDVQPTRTSQGRFGLVTYVVVPVSTECGIVEWCESYKSSEILNSF